MNPREASATNDFDPGMVPWVLTTMAWLLVPLLPFWPACIPVLFAWAMLIGAATTIAIVMVIVAALRGRSPTQFTKRALLSIAIQAAIAALFWVLILR